MAVAERYAPGDPRPILVELGTAGGGVGGTDDRSTQVIVFASDGPWDGTVCAVASDGSHTVPLPWCGPDGSMAPNLGTGRSSLPGVPCWAIQEPNASARFAVDHLLRPFRGDSRGEGRAGDGSWAGRSASRTTTPGVTDNGPRAAPHPGASKCQLKDVQPSG